MGGGGGLDSVGFWRSRKTCNEWTKWRGGAKKVGTIGRDETSIVKKKGSIHSLPAKRG